MAENVVPFRGGPAEVGAQGRQTPPVRSYADLTPTVKRGAWFLFTAPSLSTPGKVNTVRYNPSTDTTACDCYASEAGRDCWHRRHVRKAWLVRMARKDLAGLTNAELGKLEREVAARVAAGVEPVVDSALYDAIGDEWAGRLIRFPAPATPPEPEPPTPAARSRPTPLHALAPTGTEGYRAVPPPAGGLVDAEAIDASVCREATCGNCGRRGLDYRPYFRTEPRSYRAFAVCAACGHAIEF